MAVKPKTFHIMLLCSYLVVLVWSLIRPVDLLIWCFEVSPVIIGGFLLVFTYSRFQFSTLTYVLIWVTAIIMTIGGHYTYEEMPLFNWVRDALDLKRNHYDRFGHFVQGFTTAAVVREILLRKSPLLPGKWIFFIVACICLAFSASYEIFEFAGTKFMGRSAEAFLGLQGDTWDAQWDMLWAVLGAVCGLVLISGYQNRHIWRAER